MEQTFDLSSIRYVKRITIGQKDPQVLYTEEDASRDMTLLNKCLNDYPKGRIIAHEKNFTILNIGEHQVVQQWVTYHIGFAKKPVWLKDAYE